MKKRLQGFIVGVITMALLSTTVVWATYGSQNANIFYRNITIKLNNQTIHTQNEPFILQDRTYLPMRDVAEALGLNVKWDDAANTVSLSTQPTEESNENTENTENSIPDTVDSYAKEVFDLTNQFRKENGLKSFEWSEELAAVAKAHSDDMSARKFFSHTNPDGLSPFDRMTKSGLSYIAAAENIAYGQKTPAQVVEAWKNSAGHRANMLGDYQKLGVGYCENGSYWTQNFATFSSR